MGKHIRHLLLKSKEVILDCSLENGAVVAANSDTIQYPKGAKNYRFVWPRDAAFILYAAELLRVAKIRERFVHWLLERAEEFSETGLLFQRYATNGAKDACAGLQYQPDQAGALLWALASQKRYTKEARMAITLLSQGLCKAWDGKHFSRTIYDLWEERHILPSQKGNFTYTLASCSFGLGLAANRMGNKQWSKVSGEMRKVLKSCGTSFYSRGCGSGQSKRIDASVLGLVWPFSVVSQDKKLQDTLGAIKTKLLSRQGVHRYEGDRYDGSISKGKTGMSGDGGWPLLTFWYSVALSRMGRKQAARRLFLEYIKKFQDYIPEQIFQGVKQPSVSPLAWSHAMFVIASHELGYRF